MHMHHILSAFWNLIEITFMYLQKNGCFHHTQVQSNVYSCPSLLNSCSVNFIIVTSTGIWWPKHPNQVYQTKPTNPIQSFKTKHSKPNLPSITKQNYLYKSSQTSLPNQIYPTKPNNKTYQTKPPKETYSAQHTKPNSRTQEKEPNPWVHCAFGNVSLSVCDSLLIHQTSQEQDKVNNADSAFIFFIIQSQNQWSGRSGRTRWPCLVWSLLER